MILNIHLTKLLNLIIGRPRARRKGFYKTSCKISKNKKPKNKKPTHTDKYLSYDSHHPVSHKRSVGKALLQRAETLPSNSDSQTNEREYVLNVLGGNDYPKRFLNDCPFVGTKITPRVISLLRVMQ
jgi:hypothetical protein